MATFSMAQRRSSSAPDHQAKDSTTLGSWRQPVPSTSPVRSSRSRSRPCASSRGSHRSSWGWFRRGERIGRSTCPGQTRGEFGSSWGTFGFHGTVRGTLQETTPECRGRCEGGHRFPRQGSGRAGGRATESGDSQCGGCSPGAGTPNSAGESSSNHRARAHGRGSSVEISSCRIGVRTGGVPQETHSIVVSALSRHPSSAKSVPHGVGCVPRRQRFQDGSFDQSGKYHGVEFQPVQPFELTSLGIVHSVKQRMHSRERARYGLRGVRVGEANNPGPSAVEANNVMEFDLTQRDSTDVDSHSENETRVHDTLSDTESVRSWPGGRHPRRRRLRLRWHQETRADVGHRDVRVVSHLVENLARRIGCLPAGAQVPRAIQQQRWSPFNVPLMWGAASSDVSTPVLDWLGHQARSVTELVEFHGGSAHASSAVTEGWRALREVFRAWGIWSREHLSDWLGRQGFPRTAPGNHISARAQEHIFSEASAIDARVALLEAVYVLVTLQRGRDLGFPAVDRDPAPQRGSGTMSLGSSWTASICVRCFCSEFRC